MLLGRGLVSWCIPTMGLVVRGEGRVEEHLLGPVNVHMGPVQPALDIWKERP